MLVLGHGQGRIGGEDDEVRVGVRFSVTVWGKITFNLKLKPTRGTERERRSLPAAVSASHMQLVLHAPVLVIVLIPTPEMRTLCLSFLCAPRGPCGAA